MAVRTYAPSDVTVSVALVHQVTGFVDGTSIVMAKEESSFSKSKGAHGHIGRIHIPDRTFRLELRLAQTSPSNAVLNGLNSVDEASRIGMFPIFVKDTSGQSVFTSPTCWIEDLPEASYSDTIEERVWRLTCANTVFGIAGNATEERLIEQAGRLSSLITQFGSNLGVF